MDGELMGLIKELIQGKESANELRNHLNPCASNDTRDFLIQQILSSYEKALSLLHYTDSSSPSAFLNTIISPGSEASDIDSKCHKHVFKKRKTMPRVSHQVKVCSGTGAFDGTIDDGFFWRKYGQKDILGAKFPRGYYRCTHRHAQGCLATKQVQKSDEDSSVFEVTYKGRHTCNRNSVSKEKHNYKKQVQNSVQEQQQLVLNFGADFVVKAEEELENVKEKSCFPSFSFQVEPECEFLGGFSQAFISPTTSESNYFPVSPIQMNNFGFGHIVHTPESDLTDILSAPTSVVNSPIGDEFDFIKVDFDSKFPLDNLEFFA